MTSLRPSGPVADVQRRRCAPANPLQTYNGIAAPQRTRCRRTTASLRPSGPVADVQRRRCAPANPLQTYNDAAASQRSCCRRTTASTNVIWQFYPPRPLSPHRRLRCKPSRSYPSRYRGLSSGLGVSRRSPTCSATHRGLP